jgi:hypothetical protein
LETRATGNQEKAAEGKDEMGRPDILICPNCDYKRHLTEAESVISFALVVACLKCGTAMQCTPRNGPTLSGNQDAFRETLGVEAMEEWVVS